MGEVMDIPEDLAAARHEHAEVVAWLQSAQEQFPKSQARAIWLEGFIAANGGPDDSSK